jgi:hypothetical protein
MTYGHAERTLATIRRLEAETAALLHSLPRLDAEQLAWLRQVNRADPFAPGCGRQSRPGGGMTITRPRQATAPKGDWSHVVHGLSAEVGMAGMPTANPAGIGTGCQRSVRGHLLSSSMHAHPMRSRS